MAHKFLSPDEIGCTDWTQYTETLRSSGFQYAGYNVLEDTCEDCGNYLSINYYKKLVAGEYVYRRFILCGECLRLIGEVQDGD